jgi:hypothetical protein
VNIDKRTIQVAGALFVIVPMLWGIFSQVIGLYERWDTMNDRVNRLERWRCAHGGKGQELDWQRSMEECRARWETR